MFKTRLLTQAALLCSVGTILQLMPILFSDVFTIFTLLSTVPIYMITRKNMKLGLVSYIVTSILVLFFSVEEFVIFIFLNGLVGYLFGLCHSLKYIGCLLVALVLAGSISFINFVIGFPLFGFIFSFTMIGLVCVFSFIYCSMYYWFLRFLMDKVFVFKIYVKQTRH